jgi:hypothetical protein
MSVKSGVSTTPHSVTLTSVFIKAFFLLEEKQSQQKKRHLESKSTTPSRSDVEAREQACVRWTARVAA